MKEKVFDFFVNPKHFAEMAEQDGGMVGEIDAGLTLSRDIRLEDLLCQNTFVRNLDDK